MFLYWTFIQSKIMNNQWKFQVMTRSIIMVLLNERNELQVHHRESLQQHYMGESYCFKTFLHNKQFRSYVWCFSPRGYLHFDTYISRGFPSVPRFHYIQPFVLMLPDPPLSFQPFISSSEIGGGTWLIIRSRRFQ